MIVRVDGIGTVEVDGADDIAALLELLDASEVVDKADDGIDRLTKAVEDGNQQIIDALMAMAARPVVPTSASAPKAAAVEPKASPIRKIKAVKIERDFRGLITSAEFEVIR